MSAIGRAVACAHVFIYIPLFLIFILVSVYSYISNVYLIMDNSHHLLLSVDLHPLLNRLLRLVVCAALGATKDQLSNEAPFAGDVPLPRDGSVDEWVVVLEACAEAEGL